MQSYNYRSVKAIAEYRYPQVNTNLSNSNNLRASSGAASGTTQFSRGPA